MTTIQQLRDALDIQIANGKGQAPVAFGDCNKMHLVSGFGLGVVRDLEEYYLEEVHPDDLNDFIADGGDPVPVFIVGE